MACARGCAVVASKTSPSLRREWGLEAGRVGHCARRLLAWVALAALLPVPAMAAAPVEPTFDLLHTRTGLYTNATVTRKFSNYVIIIHSRGVATIGVPDLPLEVQQDLGYAVRPAKSDPGADSPRTNSILAGLNFGQVKKAEQAWRGLASKWMPNMTPNITVIYTVLGIALLFYLFFCYCNMLICQKTHTAPGLLVWLPVLQLFPMLRAAGMSRLWFLAFLVPVLNVVAQIMWYVNIVKARGKNMWIALLLALPVTGPFAFLYLAFSEAAPIEIEGEPQPLPETS
jgi:hypothetical protein